MSYELKDCGKTVKAPTFYDTVERTIQMVIKTPRGTLVIYHDPTNHYHKAGKAIKAFMGSHRRSPRNTLRGNTCSGNTRSGVRLDG